MIKITFIWTLAFLFLLNFSFASHGGYIHDNANLFLDVSELEDIASQINTYNNHGSRVVVYTVNNDRDLYDLYQNGFANNNLEDSPYFPNLNVFVLYKEGLEYPILRFSKNCGLDKDEISYVFLNEYVEAEYLPLNSEMFTSITDPDEGELYTLGVTSLLSQRKYQEAFSVVLRFLEGQIKDKIDRSVTNDKYKYCPVVERIILDELKTADLPDSLELHPDIIQRLKQIKPVVQDATRSYPSVPFELEMAKIAKESAGIRTSISSVGAYGYSQLLPCTAKDLGLVKKPACIEWYFSSSRTNVCGYKQCKKQGLVLQEDLNNIFDAKKNIFAGTKYLSRLINKCISDFSRYGAGVSDKYEVVRCALASYNAGPWTVTKAIAAADSTSFGEYSQKFSKRTKRETIPYVEEVIGYMRYLEENPDVLA